MLSEGAQPDEGAITLMVVPTGPEVGLKVAVAVVTVKALLNVWTPLVDPVMTMT
jgi:hypothetical protein